MMLLLMFVIVLLIMMQKFNADDYACPIICADADDDDAGTGSDIGTIADAHETLFFSI